MEHNNDQNILKAVDEQKQMDETYDYLVQLALEAHKCFLLYRYHLSGIIFVT